LGPRAARVIKPRLIGGQSFTAAEVTAAGQVAIELVVLVGGFASETTHIRFPRLTRPSTGRSAKSRYNEAAGTKRPHFLCCLPPSVSVVFTSLERREKLRVETAPLSVVIVRR
jgi:hypothetical protein